MDDVKRLLSLVNQRIVALRRALAHDHGDDAWWSERAITAPRAQYDRIWLRALAHHLHVERATAHGRIHCAHFATLDEQRAWLEDGKARARLLADGFLPL